jgi:hypothetical protein
MSLVGAIMKISELLQSCQILFANFFAHLCLPAGTLCANLKAVTFVNVVDFFGNI